MTNENGYTNDGQDGVKAIPVESKEPTLTSTPAETGKDEVRQELPVQDLQPVLVAKKRRGRPKLIKNITVVGLEPIQEPITYRCSTCRETFDDKGVLKIGAGQDRNAVFCPMCQKFITWEDQKFYSKVKDLQERLGEK